MQVVDFERVCPLRWWHLTEKEQLHMLVTLTEANYHEWEIYYGLYIRDGELYFVEPAEKH